MTTQRFSAQRVVQQHTTSSKSLKPQTLQKVPLTPPIIAKPVKMPQKD